MNCRNWIIGVLFASVLFACSEDEVDTYGGVEYVYFNETEKNYSFAFDPTLSEKDIAVEIKLIGNATDFDRGVSLVVDSMGANVTDEDFEVLDAKLRAGNFRDTLYVRVRKSEKFLSEIGFVRFRIERNEYFTPGPTETKYFSLSFSDILLQPEWWDNAITRDYLGNYSEKKYRYFIIATGVSDMSEMDSSEKRAYTLLFKKYIEEHNLTEDDGSPMTVTIKE